MANNPLQKFMRQPRVYINLPSKGIYNQPGTIQGDVSNIPVFGMTGMDEIILKTPDALITGSSTVSVIESCCPSVKDAWDIVNLDLECLLAAIRIATYGNELEVTHTCSNCGDVSDYTVNLTNTIDHYQKCHYENEVVVDNIKIYIRPLNYRTSSEFAQRSFAIQQQLAQLELIEDEAERKTKTNELFTAMGIIQNEMYTASIESVSADGQTVTEKVYIKEWIENCDKSVFDRIRKQINENQKIWEPPKYKVTCTECSTENEITVFLDQSNFFGDA